MYKVTGPKNGIVWNPEENKTLAQFKDGIFLTKEKKVADKLKKLGYEVNEEKESKSPGEEHDSTGNT